MDTAGHAGADFDAFYDRALPVVYGYLLRLCGGDTERAWDLTQDVWVALVRQMNRGNAEKLTIAYLISIARSRYVDEWRRSARLQRKLRLVWAAERTAASSAPHEQDVLANISRCAPAHRVVLMLAYVDDLPVAEIARLIGSSLSTTYALLERARSELRLHLTGDLA